VTDRDNADTAKTKPPENPTKPAGQEVGPPEERVDDEVGSDEPKTTRRQE
jgi:hypothetical protein